MLNYPLHIRQEEALLRRLSREHPKLELIEGSVARNKKGFRGEQNVDYHLTFLPKELKEQFLIHKNLYLSNEYSFQIDRLLLSPNVFFLIEVKNLSGPLYFEKSSGQLIQKANGEEKGYGNPLEQSERQKYQLKVWLEQRKLPLIPIENFAVISHSSTLIYSDDKSIFQRIFHAEHLVNRISKLYGKYDKPFIEEKAVKRIYQRLKKESHPQKHILEKWDIEPSELIKGIICPNCGHTPMRRYQGKWNCQNCKHSSQNAHIEALDDYFLLFKDTITNKECRDFLCIDSRRQSEYLLKKAGLKKTGENRGCYYEL